MFVEVRNTSYALRQVSFHSTSYNFVIHYGGKLTTMNIVYFPLSLWFYRKEGNSSGVKAPSVVVNIGIQD